MKSIKDIIVQEMVKVGMLDESILMYPHQIQPKKIEAFLKKYPQVEKSMKPFISARLMQGYRKWLNWKGKNEDKLGGTPHTVDSPSFGSKTFYKHDWNIAGIDSWAAVFQYLTGKQLKDSSLYSSKKESVNESIKYKKGKLYQTGGNWTVFKSGDLVALDIKVNQSAGWSTDPHDVRGETIRLMDAGKKRATLRFKEGNINNFAKTMHKLNDETTWGEKEGLSAKDYADILRVWLDMIIYSNSVVKESVNESTNTPMMSKSGKDIFVDTTFVQLSNKFGTLEHIWMGDFVVKTKDGDVEFSRVNKQIDGFSGRTHQVSGTPKAIASLIKNMKPKVVKESVNEKNIPKKGTSDYHQHKIAVDTMKNPNKSMMGGPSPKEAEQILMKKFGYSKKEIDKLNESKNDFAARYDKSNILLKKGYKHHTADELEKLYYKLGALVKGLKVKDVSVIFEKLLKTNENLDNYSKDAITDMIINLSRYEGNDKLIADLKKILKQRTLGKLKKEQSVNETFIPKVGRIDDYKLKDLLMKNPKVNAVLGDGEKSFMKKSDVVVIMHQSKRFNTIFTDGKQEFEIDMKVGKLVKPLGKARKEIVAHFSKSESVNEASRRATDFYGDSKHGKALHSLLKGKWDSKKVEKFLEKLGDGNDVKYARLIDFISGDAGLNIRKYKTVGEQLPELMKVLETLYTDFLTESITEEKTQKDLAKEINKKFGGTYRIQGYNLNIKGANASAETIKDFIEDLNKKHNLGYKRFFVKDKGSRKILGSVPFGIAITIDESITEGIWPKSKLSDRFQFLLAPALKKNFKGIFYVIGYDLYHNDKKIMVINPDKDSVTSIVNHVSRNRAIQKNESNITEGKYSNRADAMNAFFKGKISGKELDDIAKNDFNGAIATKGELTQFLKNSFMQDVMADQYGIPKSTLVKKVKELLPIVETNTTPNQTMFESVVDDNGMQRAVVALSESKKVDWKDFYTHAKDTSGYDPSFEKKYGRLLDLPHITDALNKTSDFKSFMRFISKFESVVDDSGMQRVGTALPQTDEENVSEAYHIIDRNKKDIWISDKAYKDLIKGKDVVGYTEDTHEGGHREIWVNARDVNRIKKSNTGLSKTVDQYAKYESIEESSNEPKIITQLRDVMKSGYKKLKDPKSGKVMTVDSYSASAIVKVYDALNQQNKEKFSNAGLLGMQSMAFKLIK
jgi:hypothetical protein